eukprot:TRINITY_DN12077_c0_g1_i8.p1 TRINITY_DN12077_c0_g1~~TRINITY_DN12077_c0_g1_i8.p1  ORF type:complete len:235 (+),score=-1.67 TRINITY_DN12077_c0_g1_i8:158-862(+)
MDNNISFINIRDNQSSQPQLQHSEDMSINSAIILPKKFPYCIVWTPIPLITWLFPFIGHMGICLSTGEILDFGASYFINYDNFLFGNPTKYLRLNTQKVKLADALQVRNMSLGQKWDYTLNQSVQFYQSRAYNFVSDNCHCFVAHFMNNAQYANKSKWNMINLAAMMFVFGKYTGVVGFLYTWLPFIVVLSLGTVFGDVYFLVGYGIVLLLILSLFLMTNLASFIRAKIGAGTR